MQENKLNLFFSKTRINAVIPSKKTEDAGYDIYACFDEPSLIIKPGEIVLVQTGIACAFSSDYVMIIKERSSTGVKGMALRMGVVDSGYRWEIHIAINNTTKTPIVITKDITSFNSSEFIIHPYEKAIAQAVIFIMPQLEAREIPYDDLKRIQSERSISFLGASGK